MSTPLTDSDGTQTILARQVGFLVWLRQVWTDGGTDVDADDADSTSNGSRPRLGLAHIRSSLGAETPQHEAASATC